MIHHIWRIARRVFRFIMIILAIIIRDVKWSFGNEMDNQKKLKTFQKPCIRYKTVSSQKSQLSNFQNKWLQQNDLLLVMVNNWEKRDQIVYTYALEFLDQQEHSVQCSGHMMILCAPVVPRNSNFLALSKYFILNGILTKYKIDDWYCYPIRHNIRTKKVKLLLTLYRPLPPHPFFT